MKKKPRKKWSVVIEKLRKSKSASREKLLRLLKLKQKLRKKSKNGFRKNKKQQ